MRDHIKAVQQDFPDVQAGVTGSMALGSDEMVSSQRDTALATVLSLISVGILYIAIFWEVWSPLRVQIAATGYLLVPGLGDPHRWPFKHSLGILCPGSHRSGGQPGHSPGGAL